MQAFEAEVRQQLKRPQTLVEAQAVAAQAEWDWAHSSDTFDHKLVTAIDKTHSAHNTTTCLEWSTILTWPNVLQSPSKW